MYKLYIIVKGFIGIILNGVVLFVSEFYCGLISDFEIVEKLGFYNYLYKGDFVMVDKGFFIKD